MNRVTSTLGLMFLVACMCACQTDRRPPVWDGGIAGDADTDVGDDTEPEPKVIPESPPEDSVCHDGWCWLAPRPFGHSVDHLRGAGDDIFGVARVDSVRGYERFVWGDEFDILETPQVDGSSLADMTTTADGWLAVRASRGAADDRTVYDFGPEGLRDTVELPDGCASGIAGTSLDKFAVWLRRGQRCTGGGDVARHRGEILDVEVEFGARFWPNGDVWGMGVTAPDQLVEDWNIQELGPRGSVVGPAPTSPCASQGRWVAGADDEVYWWTEDRGSWWENHKLRVVIRDFACSRNQRMTAVSEAGQFHRRVGVQDWKSEQLSETELHSLLRRDGTTYIAGESGALFTRSDGEFTQISTPFGPLNDSSPEDLEAHTVADIWVSKDGTDAVVLDHEEMYRKTEERWEQVPISPPEDPLVGAEKVWGITSPQLMTRDSAVYRWNGAVWEGAAENVLNPDESVIDIDGHSPSNMWIAESHGLAHFDGQTWNDLAESGSALRSELEARDADISDIYATDDHGTLLLAVGEEILEVSAPEDDAQVEEVADSPCGTVQHIYRTDGGELYLGTESDCIASRSDGTWQTRDISPRRVFEFEPHPSGPSPLVVTQTGLLKPQEDGSFAEAFLGETVAASAVPGLDAVVLGHEQGLLIKHF